MTSDEPRRRTLPAERCYWALLDTSALPEPPPLAAGRRRRRLGYLFETVLPVPIEEVHAVYRRLDRHRYLACAIDRTELAELSRAGPLAASPDRVPDLLGADCPADALNLLVGEHEPTALRRRRARVTALTCALLLACALLLLVGQARRAARSREAAAEHLASIAAIYEQVLPPGGGPLPPAARLTAERRALESTRAPDAASDRPADVLPVLQSLLACWPDGVHLTTETLSVSPSAISISARVPDETEAERLERGFKPPSGWRLGQPSMQRDRAGISIRVRLEPGDRP